MTVTAHAAAILAAYDRDPVAGITTHELLSVPQLGPPTPIRPPANDLRIQSARVPALSLPNRCVLYVGPSYRHPREASVSTTEDSPMVDDIRSAMAELAANFAGEQRWPHFAVAAMELGVRSMMSFHLYTYPDRTPGAITGPRCA